MCFLKSMPSVWEFNYTWQSLFTCEKNFMLFRWWSWIDVYKSYLFFLPLKCQWNCTCYLRPIERACCSCICFWCIIWSFPICMLFSAEEIIFLFLLVCVISKFCEIPNSELMVVWLFLFYRNIYAVWIFFLMIFLGVMVSFLGGEQWMRFAEKK